MCCRIMLVDNPHLIPSHILLRTLTNLEKQGGGDGIGVGYYEGIYPVVKKGCNLTPRYITGFVRQLARPVMIHLRKASQGTRTNNELCHPFITRDGIFCHNGTVAELIGNGTTDTNIIRELINNAGFSKVSSILRNYGVLALLTPDNEFKVRIGHNKRDNKRDFEWVEYPNYHIGISDASTMLSSWKEKKEEIEVEEEEYEEPMIPVKLTHKQYKKIYGEEAYWCKEKFIPISVPLSTMEEFCLCVDCTG